MKIPFDIKFRPQIESGEYKIVTTKGQSVRIICWDRNTTYWKLVALVLAPDGKTENPFTYDINGNESDGCMHNHEFDLFIITPEEGLTEFESKLKYIVDNLTNNITYRNVMKERFNRGDEDEQIKEYASELLAFARKEIVHNIADSGLDSLAHKIGYQKGFEAGKAEALNDLPRWKKWGNGAAGNAEGHAIALVKGAGGLRFTSVLCATGEKYIMLDDLMKLPGFKE